MENSTDVFGVTSETSGQENDVRIQAMSFLMYKIGKFLFVNLHKGQNNCPKHSKLLHMKQSSRKIFFKDPI